MCKVDYLNVHHHKEENLMNVILKVSVNHLGRAGEIVHVKSGFARNYLIPKGLVMTASKQNMIKLEEGRAKMEQAEEEKKKQAKVLVKEIEALSIVIPVETNEDDQLFGSVNPQDVVLALEAQGVTVEKRDVLLSEGAIHALGIHPAEVVCHIDVRAKINVQVTKVNNA